MEKIKIRTIEALKNVTKNHCLTQTYLEYTGHSLKKNKLLTIRPSNSNFKKIKQLAYYIGVWTKMLLMTESLINQIKKVSLKRPHR